LKIKKSKQNNIWYLAFFIRTKAPTAPGHFVSETYFLIADSCL